MGLRFLVCALVCFSATALAVSSAQTPAQPKVIPKGEPVDPWPSVQVNTGVGLGGWLEERFNAQASHCFGQQPPFQIKLVRQDWGITRTAPMTAIPAQVYAELRLAKAANNGIQKNADRPVFVVQQGSVGREDNVGLARIFAKVFTADPTSTATGMDDFVDSALSLTRADPTLDGQLPVAGISGGQYNSYCEGSNVLSADIKAKWHFGFDVDASAGSAFNRKRSDSLSLIKGVFKSPFLSSVSSSPPRDGEAGRATFFSAALIWDWYRRRSAGEAGAEDKTFYVLDHFNGVSVVSATDARAEITAYVGLNGQTSFYGIDAAAKGSYNASQTEGASFKSYGVAVERKANNLSWEWTFSPLTKIDAAATVAKAYVKSEIVPAVAGEGPPKLWGTESVPFFARLWDLPAGLCQEATWYVPLEEPSTTGKMTLKGSVAYAQTGTGRFYCDFHIDYTPSLDDLKKEGQRLSVEFSLQTAVGKHTLTLKPSPVSFDVPIVPSVVRMSQSLLQSTYQNGTYTWHFDYEPRNLGNLVLLGFAAQKLVCGSQNILTFHAEPAIGPAYKVPATLYVYETEISAPEGVCTFSATPEFSNTGNRPAIVGPTMESSRLQWKPTSSPAVASSAAAPNVVPGTAQPKVAATPLAAGSPN